MFHSLQIFIAKHAQNLKFSPIHTPYCGQGDWIKSRTVKEWSVYCMDWNEPLVVATVMALAGVEMVLGRPTASLDWRLVVQKVEERPRVSLLRYMYKIAVQNLLLSDTDNYSFRHGQYWSYIMLNCQCKCNCNCQFIFDSLWTLRHSVLKITAGRTPNYNVLVPRSHVA